MEYLQIEVEKSLFKAGEYQSNIERAFMMYLHRYYKKEEVELRKLLKINKMDQSIVVRKEFLINYPDIQKQYYEILKNYNYRDKEDLIDCISYFKDSTDIKSDILKWQKTPFIDKITYNDLNKVINVYSKFGQFEFVLLKEMYPDTLNQIKEKHRQVMTGVDISRYTSSSSYNPYEPGNLEYACHFCTQEFVKKFKETYAVTAKCPHVFNNTYWFHSYILTNDDIYVLDFAKGIIMKKDMYYELMEPDVLDKTIGYDIESRLELIRKDEEFYARSLVDTNPLLTLALYNRERSFVKQKNTKI